MEDIIFVRVRERVEGGKSLHPANVVIDDCADLRLLAHYFRDENRIRVGGATPWQIAARFAEPVRESLPNLCGIRSCRRLLALHLNGEMLFLRVDDKPAAENDAHLPADDGAGGTFARTARRAGLAV